MGITCDVREKDVICLLGATCEYTIKQLPLGDFIIEQDEYMMIVERKTMDDLSASIVDGRYQEQKNRMLEMKQQGVVVIYIIEGEKTTSSGISEDTLHSTLLSLSLKSLFHVFKTNNTQDTVNMLLKMNKNIHSYFENTPALSSRIIIPKRNFNLSEQLNIVCCVRGISATHAANILAVHTSIHDLCTFLKEYGPQSLCNIPKIGPKLSTSIYRAFIETV